MFNRGVIIFNEINNKCFSDLVIKHQCSSLKLIKKK